MHILHMYTLHTYYKARVILIIIMRKTKINYYVKAKEVFVIRHARPKVSLRALFAKR
jgi:hypothetical protein